MTAFRFDRSPAYVTIGEGLSLAARYWRDSAERWVLAVAAVALATGLAEWLLGGTVIDQPTMTRALLPGTSGQIDPSELPRLLAGPLAVGLVSLVAGWFFAANAVAGLRNCEVTVPWVLAAGLRAFTAAMLIALTFLSLVLLAVALGVIGLLLLLALVPVAIYLGIRLQFWTLAIFDGSSIDRGARSSWALTRGAVLRALGWWLALFGIGLLVTAVDVVIRLASAGAPVIGTVITATIDAAFQAFTIAVLAVLYESQRLRNQPPAMPLPQAPYDPQGPLPPPPPPAPPTDPWQG